MPEGQPLTQSTVTTLLIRARQGDRLATAELFPVVYEELRGIAAQYLTKESAAQTLQPTALVNEAFIRLVGPSETSWENRRHFFGAAANAMRRILMDHARAKRRMKRGAGVKPACLDEAEVGVNGVDLDLLALDEALKRLAQADPAKAQLVELRFFAGLTLEETSQLQGVSLSTAARDWRFVRAWLHRELSGEGPE
jgi:RNA polymerase sigma factor (TIGR02999 family)